MTAPLYLNQNKTLKEEMLAHTSTQLLKAIKDNNLNEVELKMSEILQNDVPEVSIRLFFNYAKAQQRPKVCDYLGQVLLATYNT